MMVLAAAEDLWDANGRGFLIVYGVALAVLLALALGLRARATRVGSGAPTRSPTPAAIAMIQDGPGRAVHASVAGLRVARAVGSGDGQTLTVTDRVPAGLSRLDRAVLDAAGRAVPVHRLATDPLVRSALDDLENDLVRAGWRPDPARYFRARLGGWLLLGLGAAGVVRVIVAAANGQKPALLVLMTAGALVAGVLLAQVYAPRISAAGRRVVASAHRSHGHLHPWMAPAWETYGLTGAAMGVALFGTSALWAADPAFAGAVGIERQSLDRVSTLSAGGCGSGGDGCGAGGCGAGGCGAGGCGGGCGGG